MCLRLKKAVYCKAFTYIAVSEICRRHAFWAEAFRAHQSTEENSFIEIDWPGRLKGDDNQENANRVNLFVESGAGTICIRHKMVSVPVKSPNSKARKQIKIFT